MNEIIITTGQGFGHILEAACAELEQIPQFTQDQLETEDCAHLIWENEWSPWEHAEGVRFHWQFQLARHYFRMGQASVLID